MNLFNSIEILGELSGETNLMNREVLYNSTLNLINSKTNLNKTNKSNRFIMIAQFAFKAYKFKILKKEKS